MANDSLERRRYHRVRAPLLVRPVSALARLRRRVNDVSLGGLRSYADEAPKPGTRMEMELLFPEGDTAVMLVEVVWVEELGEAAPAPYDVGLRYVDAREEDLARIAKLLDG